MASPQPPGASGNERYRFFGIMCSRLSHDLAIDHKSFFVEVTTTISKLSALRAYSIACGRSRSANTFGLIGFRRTKQSQKRQIRILRVHEVPDDLQIVEHHHEGVDRYECRDTTHEHKSAPTIK